MDSIVLDLINRAIRNSSITADIWIDNNEIQTEDADAYKVIFNFLDLLGIDFTSGEPEEEGEFYYIYFD